MTVALSSCNARAGLRLALRRCGIEEHCYLLLRILRVPFKFIIFLCLLFVPPPNQDEALAAAAARGPSYFAVAEGVPAERGIQIVSFVLNFLVDRLFLSQ